MEGLILVMAETYHVAPWVVERDCPAEWWDVMLADIDIRAEMAEEKATDASR